jgi:hypothetical protein
MKPVHTVPHGQEIGIPAPSQSDCATARFPPPRPPPGPPERRLPSGPRMSSPTSPSSGISAWTNVYRTVAPPGIVADGRGMTSIRSHWVNEVAAPRMRCKVIA